MQDENTCLSDWDAIEKSAADAISESAESFADATVANVRDLIAACRKYYLVPDGVAKGYWSTINLWWEGCAVEVFDDHYEWYRFEQGHTDIRHFDHAPAAPVPEGLLSRLPKRI